MAIQKIATKKAPLPSNLAEVDVEDLGQYELPEDWKDAEAVIRSGARRVLLYGIPGTGKTFAGNHFGVEQRQEDVFNIYFGEETSAYQVVGTDSIVDGTMVWRDGPGLLAWRCERGGRLVINEIDHASGDALDALMWLCDDEKSARVTLPTGEYLEPKPGYQAVATMNGEPEDLPEAIADRFVTRVKIRRPHPAAIMALPAELRDLASNLSHDGVPEERRVSIRQFRAFAELLLLGVAYDSAARAAFHSKATDLIASIGVAKLKKIGKGGARK